MLVLSRKCDQSLMVGENVVVTVLGIDGDRVKLGIQAPRSVTVLRQEVFEQLRSANARAAATAPAALQSVAAALRKRTADSVLIRS